MSKEALTKTIATLDAQIALHDENVAEAANLFATGKLNQDGLDHALAERDNAVARRKAMHDALQAAVAKGVRVATAEIEQARKDANKRALDLLPQIDATAAEIDGLVENLVAAINRLDDLHSQIRAEAFDAGVVDHNQRHYTTDLRAVSALIADRLNRSGVTQKLDFITISNGTYMEPGSTLASLTKGRTAKLAGLLKKVA